MEPAHGGLDALREMALRDDPACATARADIEAWDRAEGLASEAAADAIRRKDVERLIPGLSARRTYKALGRIVVAAVIVDSALAWLPPSNVVDTLDGLIRYGTAILGVAVAAWSLLSEARGWNGSDAATWFLKVRVDRTFKKIEARRRTLSETVVAVSATGFAVYRDAGGEVARETFVPDAILGLTQEVEASHMALCLTTSTGTRYFEWLPRDPAFETAVTRLAGVAHHTRRDPTSRRDV